ncbi:MAG: PEPxxWA-CTERM sorting domain-containing protein [Sphingomonadaceae bacterium]
MRGFCNPGDDRGSVTDGAGWITSFEATGTFSQPLPANFIPEPATWAMMIAGFGLVGTAARRRRDASVRVG